MSAQHYAARAKLRTLQQEYPTWTHKQMAEDIGYSIPWVRKWRKRIKEAPLGDEMVLWGQSRARKTSSSKCTPEVVERILEIRDDPPENLKRTPGPLAVLYYLHKDEPLEAQKVDLPRSTRTIWKVLDQYQRIIRPRSPQSIPWELPTPMSAWQIDFKDVSTVPPDPEGKQMHVVETFNVMDTGTSILLDTETRGDFNEETALLAMARTLLTHGLPQMITFDRDTRFVGSAQGRDFPSPFIRFLTCLGIVPNICPPRRPDRNPFVERYHGTYDRECLQVHRPTDVEQARQVTETFRGHYNHERPNQARSCGNQPPCVAFSSLPILPHVPDKIDPDAWLENIHGKRFTRKVRANGTITVDNQVYYVTRKLRGQRVALVVDAFERQFIVLHRKEVIKRIPIKALYNGELPFQAYLKMMCKEAISQRRRYSARRRK